MSRYITNGAIHANIQQGGVVLLFQPIVSSADPSQVVFYEGLMRMKSEEHGIILAAEIYPRIKDNKQLISTVHFQSILYGIKTLVERDDIHLSLNMSPESLESAQWQEVLSTLLSENPQIGPRLILEITEHIAMSNVPEVLRFMDHMREFGVRFALDDFGAGQTSLRYFKDFKFDIIKIDGQFVQDIHMDKDNQVIISALMTIARHFDMKVVAEKVRAPEVASTLNDLGVDYLQGFLFQEAGELPLKSG